MALSWHCKTSQRFVDSSSTNMVLTLCNELPMCRRRMMVMAVCVSIVHCGPGLGEPSYSSQDQDNTGEG